MHILSRRHDKLASYSTYMHAYQTQIVLYIYIYIYIYVYK